MATSTNWFAIDPPDATGYHDRNQDSQENGLSAAGVQPLEKIDHRPQQQCQSHRKGEGDQNGWGRVVNPAIDRACLMTGSCNLHSKSNRRQDLSGLKRVICRASAAVFVPRSFP